MIKYRYTLNNQKIETLDINSIPYGLSYETIEFEPEKEIDFDEINRIQMLSVEAEELLKKSDITILRCYENAIEIPDEWVVYRNNLRLIKNGSGEDIPEIPQYPENS